MEQERFRKEQLERERQEREARERAEQEAKERAERQAKERAEREARDQAEREAREREGEEAKRRAEQEAKSNEPVTFSAGQASWQRKPSFAFPDRAARRARPGDRFTVKLKLRVNKQGGIDSATVAKSSGNNILDRAAVQQVKRGKFNPFKQNGVPVVGVVTLPIDYVVP